MSVSAQSSFLVPRKALMKTQITVLDPQYSQEAVGEQGDGRDSPGTHKTFRQPSWELQISQNEAGTLDSTYTF